MQSVLLSIAPEYALYRSIAEIEQLAVTQIEMASN